MNATPKVKNATTSYHDSTKRTKREAVLLVAHGDGWIEAYAERHVDVRIEIAPYVTTPRGEILAEDYVGLSLPQRYRDLYWPGMRRAADLVRRITPADIAQRDWDVELLRSIEKAGKNLRGDVTSESEVVSCLI